MNATFKISDTYEGTFSSKVITLPDPGIDVSNDEFLDAVISVIREAFNSEDCTDESIFEVICAGGKTVFICDYCEGWLDHTPGWHLYRAYNHGIPSYVCRVEM